MENVIDLKKLDITQLKALAFDRLVIIERTSEELKIINGEIKRLSEESKKTVSEVKEEVKTQ